MSIETQMNLVKITIPSDPNNVCVARTAAETFAQRQGFDVEQAGQIGLALNEALANVIEHGYEGKTNQEIVVTLERVETAGRACLKVVVKDFGRQVDPGAIKGRELDDVRPGGIGVHIMKAVMDQVQYDCPGDGGMELTMSKFLTDNKDGCHE